MVVRGTWLQLNQFYFESNAAGGWSTCSVCFSNELSMYVCKSQIKYIDQKISEVWNLWPEQRLRIKHCRTGRRHTLQDLQKPEDIYWLTMQVMHHHPFSELLWSNICILHLKTWVNFPVSCAALFQDPLQQAAHLELHILLIKDSLNALDIQCGYQMLKFSWKLNHTA